MHIRKEDDIKMEDNTEYFNKKEIVGAIIQKYLVPNLYTLKLTPFEYVDEDTMSKFDPLKSKKKIKAVFDNGIENKEHFLNIVKNTYASMAWAIACQINTDFITELITNSSVQTKNFDLQNNKRWDESDIDFKAEIKNIRKKMKEIGSEKGYEVKITSRFTKPLNDIRAIKQDIESEEGYKLDIILLHDTNYYELFDGIEEGDFNYPPRDDRFYDHIISLHNPTCWVVGLPEGTGLKEGSIIGIGSYQGILCVSNYVHVDPKFEFKEEPNIPLMVDVGLKNDESTEVKAWINSKFKVTRPLGIFYKENVI